MLVKDIIINANGLKLLLRLLHLVVLLILVKVDGNLVFAITF